MFPIHHVLPQHLAGHRVLRFLADRFNVDAIKNRMALPSRQGIADTLESSPHTGGHLGTYYNGFRRYLKDVEISTRFDAALAGRQWASDEIASDLNRLVAAAKYAQANGHLFPNTPTGMTSEEADEANTKWFENWRKYAEDNEAQIQEMQDNVDQLSASGQWEGALHWPLLSPTSSLSLQDRIDILNRFPKGSPISRHFTAIGPVPALPGLVPSFVDTRLPGFIPPSFGDLNQPEGFRPSNPLLTYGLRGFPALDPDWQRIGQPPPSTAAPPVPQIVQFDPETGRQSFMSDGSPRMGPNPYDMPRDPADPSPLYGMAIFAAAMAAPELLALLPSWPGLLGALGAAGVTAGSPAHAGSTKNFGEGVFGTGAPPYNPFKPDDTPSANKIGQLLGPRTGAPQAVTKPIDQGSTGAANFSDRFGDWPGTSAATTFAQPSNAYGAPAASAAGTVAPDEVRRLTRVNASNAGSVFTSGSAPIPYLSPSEFSDRFGNWIMPTEEGQQQPSRPIGAFADEPSHIVPPPIFGLDNPGNPRNDADEWFSRWVQPLLRQE